MYWILPWHISTVNNNTIIYGMEKNGHDIYDFDVEVTDSNNNTIISETFSDIEDFCIIHNFTSTGMYKVTISGLDKPYAYYAGDPGIWFTYECYILIQ